MESDLSQNGTYLPRAANLGNLLARETLLDGLEGQYGHTAWPNPCEQELDTASDLCRVYNENLAQFQDPEFDIPFFDEIDQYNDIPEGTENDAFDLDGMVTSKRNDQSPPSPIPFLDHLPQPKSPPMLERYLSDPSDDESADINHIKAAATKTTELCFTALVSPQTFSLFSPPFYCSSESTSIDLGLINLEYPAYRSVSGPRSLGGKSGESNISAASAGSIGSYISLSGRRKSALRIRCRSPGRKAKKHNPEQHIPKTQFMYECTFCMATFKTQGNWVRHEESIHLVLDKWICAPKGPTDLQTGLCVYCRCKHLPDDTSQYCRSVCAAKDIKTRTFCRKGHLKQHLKRIHGTEWRGAFDSWLQRSSPPDISRCGFCGSNFNSWARRKIHVGAHFYAGKKMEEWDGDWGFSTDWMKRLDGAILPSERLRYRLTDNCENFSKLMDKYDEPCKPQDDRELNFWNFDARLFSTSRCDLENTISLRCKSPEKWLVCDVLDDHEPGSPNSQVPESQLVTSYYDNKEDTLRNTRKRKRDEVCTKPIDTPQYPQYPAKLISQHTSNSSDEGATPANPSKKKQRLTRQLPVI